MTVHTDNKSALADLFDELAKLRQVGKTLHATERNQELNWMAICIRDTRIATTGFLRKPIKGER